MAGDEPLGIWSPAAQKLPEEEFIANVRRRATQPLGPATVRLAIAGTVFAAFFAALLAVLLSGARTALWLKLGALGAWLGCPWATILYGMVLIWRIAAGQRRIWPPREAVLLLTFRQRLEALGQDVPGEPKAPLAWGAVWPCWAGDPASVVRQAGDETHPARQRDWLWQLILGQVAMLLVGAFAAAIWCVMCSVGLLLPAFLVGSALGAVVFLAVLVALVRAAAAVIVRTRPVRPRDKLLLQYHDRLRELEGAGDQAGASHQVE